MRRRYAASLSEHPLAAQAVGETAGGILDVLDAPPDLLIAFMGPEHLPMVHEITRALRSVLNPRVLLGAAGAEVLGTSQELGGGPGLALFAARFGTEITPMRMESFVGPDDELLITGGNGLERGEGTLLILADESSFPVDAVIDHLSDAVPDVQIAGGMVPTSRRPGARTMILDDERFSDGAVGVLIPTDVAVSCVVSQGCRPIGEPMVVTKAEGGVVYELAGRPALERLMGDVDQLDAATRALAATDLRIGVVVDEHRRDFGPGDFLIRGVIGADRNNGAIAIGASVDVGTTVQFHVRDPATADEELQSLLADRDASAALAFTCSDRGGSTGGSIHHDATLITETLGFIPTAGMFCPGEIGPVGGRSFLHSVSASLVLFD